MVEGGWGWFWGLGVEGGRDGSAYRALYLRSVLDSFGGGLIGPFLSYFALDLGASDVDLGWFTAVTNLTPNLMQVVWGGLSDRVGRRVPFIFLGGLWTALMWLLILESGSPGLLILLLGVQALVGSMAIPAWSALQGDLIPPGLRGRLTSSIAFWAAVGSIVATLTTSVYFLISATTTYLIPFLAAAIIGVAASISILWVRGREHLRPVPTGQLMPAHLLRRLKELPNFRRFLLASTLYGFFMAVSWPLFIETQVTLLRMSRLEVGLLTVVNALCTVVFQRWAGTLLDRAGRRPVMLLHRFGLVLVPVTYALAPFFVPLTDVLLLFGINALTGFLLAVGNLAVLVYLLDVVPEMYRGSLTALYNAVIGVAYFFGSLFGGYLTQILLGSLTLTLALLVVYAVSAVGRTAGAFSFLQVRESYQHDSSMKEEFMKHLRRNSR